MLKRFGPLVEPYLRSTTNPSATIEKTIAMILSVWVDIDLTSYLLMMGVIVY